MRVWMPHLRLFGGDRWSVGFYTRPQPFFERRKKVTFNNGEIHYSWWRLLFKIERND